MVISVIGEIKREGNKKCQRRWWDVVVLNRVVPGDCTGKAGRKWAVWDLEGELSKQRNQQYQRWEHISLIKPPKTVSVCLRIQQEEHSWEMRWHIGFETHADNRKEWDGLMCESRIWSILFRDQIWLDVSHLSTFVRCFFPNPSEEKVILSRKMIYFRRNLLGYRTWTSQKLDCRSKIISHHPSLTPTSLKTF